MINAILVDDEMHCLSALSILIKEHCPDVHVLERCSSVKQGIESIKKFKPDLVFLDIEMPRANGFDLLECFDEISFSVIFTTGYDQYAIKAIRFSALDYLLKPIDPNELVAAVNKFRARPHPTFVEQLRIFMNTMRGTAMSLNKIALATKDGYELIFVDQIIRCEADDNYTYFHLKGQKKITVSRTLKEIEQQLAAFPFFVRVHHSYIANLNEVNKYVRGEGGYLIMSDGVSINVSRSRKDILIKYFE